MEIEALSSGKLTTDRVISVLEPCIPCGYGDIRKLSEINRQKSEARKAKRLEKAAALAKSEEKETLTFTDKVIIKKVEPRNMPEPKEEKVVAESRSTGLNGYGSAAEMVCGMQNPGFVMSEKMQVYLGLMKSPIVEKLQKHQELARKMVSPLSEVVFRPLAWKGYSQIMRYLVDYDKIFHYQKIMKEAMMPSMELCKLMADAVGGSRCIGSVAEKKNV